MFKARLLSHLHTPVQSLHEVGVALHNVNVFTIAGRVQHKSGTNLELPFPATQGDH